MILLFSVMKFIENKFNINKTKRNELNSFLFYVSVNL